jgi:hypothetical protein
MKKISCEIACLLKAPRDLQMLLAAVARLDGDIAHIKFGKVYGVQYLILFLKPLTRNKATR